MSERNKEQEDVDSHLDIACETCRLGPPKTADFKCIFCCARNIEQMLEYMAEFGEPGHADRIRDRLVEKWVREA
jgi:hypothetical protein